MKRSISFISIAFFLLLAASANAQVKSVENEVEKQGTNRINNKIDKGVNKGLDKIEDGIGSLFGKKKKNKNKANTTNEAQQQQQQQNGGEATNENGADNQAAQPVQPNVVWSKFDFVPGDEVIFEDGPSTDEENGEFPSRWDSYKGNAEIVNVDGEPAIVIPQRMSVIVPYLKNSNEDYLPEIFTIEFDCYFEANEPSISYIIHLYDQKNQSKILSSNSNKDNYRFKIDEDDIYEYSNGTNYKYNGANNLNNGADGIWRHISVAFTKGKLKIYMDEVRLLNIPHYPENPLGVSIETMSNNDEDLRLIKNFRIAKGGVKYYDRVLSDGKIIVNGIRFDVNQATIKPESNGAINEIFELMQKQSDLNFSVEGHTDSDGDDALNQSLSEQRAKAVMDRLINMGIPSNRLKSAGWGESKPIGGNGTTEGKANNRRVEFVKF